MKTVLIIGSEGFGVSKLLLKNSDFVVKIPMVGHVNSLNASVACAIFLAQIYSMRNPL
jgi:23S rRNA (guanosine2251-2'-O)-methyltransferase